MNKEVKKCKKCKRIITNPKNKSGLCSQCIQKHNALLTIVVSSVLIIPRIIRFLKENVPKFFKIFIKN